MRFATLTAAFCLACPAAGDFIYIPGDYPSIQSGIDASSDGDEIIVAPGTYFERIDFDGRTITVRASDPDPEDTVIDGLGFGPVVTIAGGEGPGTTLEGFTVRNGALVDGAGLFTDVSPTIRACVFEDHVAGHSGGAMRSDGGHPVLEACTFRNNEAVVGGAVYAWDGSLTVIDCTFEDNTAVSSGGAITMPVQADLIEIFDSTFRNNSSASGYGAALLSYADEARVERCTFEDNVADSIGVLHNGGLFFVVEDCVFRGNLGTCIRTSAEDARIRRCDFEDNLAAVYAATSGLYQYDGHVRLSNCRFRNNEGAFGLSDAAVWNCLVRSSVNIDVPTIVIEEGAVEISNTTIVDNEAVVFDLHYNSLTQVANSIVRGFDDGLVDGSLQDLVIRYSNVEGGYEGTGNIDAQAEFVNPGRADFRLGPGSPCIDAGRNGLVEAAADTDLDGNARIMSDPDAEDTGVGTAPIVDMGCYERLTPIRYVDLNATGAGTGHTWTDAYGDLQDALDEASTSDVDEIWVAAGTYKPDRATGDRDLSFEMQSGLDIIGGYAAGELERDANDPAANATVLGGAIGGSGTADNSYHVVTATNVDGTGRLIGFIIQRGNAQDAIGNGGGIYIDGGAPVIRECIVRLNEANLGGAGIYSKDAGTKIHRCKVNRNVNNSAVPGAGLSFLRGDALVTNSFIHGNEGNGLGIGLYHVDGTLDVVNTTVFGNRSHDNQNAGVYNPGGSIFLANTVVWGNVGDGGSLERQQIMDSGVEFTVDYSIVEGWSGVFDGVGSSGDDPMFVDANGIDDIIGTADDNVRLQPGSPAIDSGDNDALPEYDDLDLDGRARYVDDPATTDSGAGIAPIVDRGAYEFEPECSADVTGDGAVNVQDLLAILAAWGPCAGCAEDIDDTGAVDVGDLLAVLAAWGPCPGA